MTATDRPARTFSELIASPSYPGELSASLLPYSNCLGEHVTSLLNAARAAGQGFNAADLRSAGESAKVACSAIREEALRQGEAALGPSYGTATARRAEVEKALAGLEGMYATIPDRMVQPGRGVSKAQ